MNKISEIRKKVQENGSVTIGVDDFNQLQSEWVKRAEIEVANVVDISDFITYLRMCGFGVGSWSYSTEQLQDSNVLNEIASTISKLNNIDIVQAKRIADHLATHTFSLGQSKLDLSNVVSPHSLPELLNNQLNK